MTRILAAILATTALSLGACTTAPPTKTLPSSAYSRVVSSDGPVWAALVVTRPWSDARKRLPTFISRKQPVP